MHRRDKASRKDSVLAARLLQQSRLHSRKRVTEQEKENDDLFHSGGKRIL